MNTEALWSHALDHLHATAPQPDLLLAQWRSEGPEQCTDQDLLREYGWVVACCGLTPQVIMKRWDKLGEAFFGWDPALVATHDRDARTAALGVLRNGRKVEAIAAFAQDLARDSGWMAHLASMPAREALAQLTTLPFVGPNNKYHLARNLGWDVVVRTGPVSRLAEYLEMTSDQLCGVIAATAGERIRTVDLVLWYWGHQVGDRSMKEMASLFKLL